MPAKRRNGPVSKLRRKLQSAKKAADRRVAVALAKYLKQANPGRKVPAQVRVRKNRGGSITITPLKARRASRKR